MQIHIKRLTTHNIFILVTYVLAVVGCYFIMPAASRNTYVFYMMILTIALAFVTLSDLVREEKYKRVLFVLGICILGAVMAFRAQTGTDDLVYRNYFFRAENRSLFSFLKESKLEAGYAVINYILYHLTGANYDIAQAVITYFSFAMWGKALQKTKEYASLPVLVLLIWTQFYFLIMRAGIIRIFLAAPIVFYALHYLWERQWKKYVLFIIIAALFHLSALIMLLFLVLFIQKEWFYKHWGYLIAALSILIPVAFVVIAKVIAPLLGARYSIYTSINFSISVGDFDVLPIWLIGLYHYQHVKDDSERDRYIVGMLLVSLSIIFSVFDTIGSFGRLIFYSNLGVLVIVASICKKKPKGIIELGIDIMLIIYAMFYLMYTTFLNEHSWDNIFPYVSFWGSI